MAKLEWKSPIEAVHGKLFGGFGAAKRKSANADGEQANFSVFYGKRSSEPSTEELAKRAKWGAIAKMVAQRRCDISKRTTDRAAFKAQSAIPTMTKYLWSVCTAQYNTEHPTA